MYKKAKYIKRSKKREQTHIQSAKDTQNVKKNKRKCFLLYLIMTKTKIIIKKSIIIRTDERRDSKIYLKNKSKPPKNFKREKIKHFSNKEKKFLEI